MNATVRMCLTGFYAIYGPFFSRLGQSQYGLLHFPHRSALPVPLKHHSTLQRLQCLISLFGVLDRIMH
jgi:hypothetical protein